MGFFGSPGKNEAGYAQAKARSAAIERQRKADRERSARIVKQKEAAKLSHKRARKEAAARREEIRVNRWGLKSSQRKASGWW